MQKIQVTKINPTTLEVEILGTFSHYNDAIEFLHLHLDKEYKFDDWLKCYYGNHLTLGIMSIPKETDSQISIGLLLGY